MISIALGVLILIAVLVLDTVFTFGFATIFDMLFVGALVLLSTVFFGIVIHELGHVIGGLANNYHFLGIQILWLYIYSENGRLKARFDKKPRALGLAIMIPGEGVTDRNHMNYFRSGYLANALTLILALFLMFFFPHLRFHLFLFAVITVLLIIPNVIPKDVNGFLNDGYLVGLYRSNEPGSIKKVQSLQGELIRGIRPRDLPETEYEDLKDVFTVMLDLFYYYQALDRGDIVRTMEQMRRIESEYTKYANIQTMTIVYELIYYYSRIVRNPFEATRLFHSVESSLMNDRDINGRRVLAYYQFDVLIDPEKALRSIREGLEVEGAYPIRGLAQMEVDLLSALQREIEEEGTARTWQKS